MTRPVLSARGPMIEATLATINFAGFDVDNTRSWGNALLSARDRWADRNRNGRRYSDRETAQRRNCLGRSA